MTDEERKRFESLEALRSGAYTSFNDRRLYEWKLNLAIWTAQAVLIAGLVQPSKQGEAFPLRGPGAWIATAVLGVLILLLHAWWSDRAARANAIDKGVALLCSKEMERMAGIALDEELKKRIETHPKQVGWTQWSHLGELGITALLAMAATVVVWVRSS